MERKEFIEKSIRWGLLLTLAGITAVVAKRVSTSRDCNSCPVYATCPGTSSCTINEEDKG